MCQIVNQSVSNLLLEESRRSDKSSFMANVANEPKESRDRYAYVLESRSSLLVREVAAVHRKGLG